MTTLQTSASALNLDRLAAQAAQRIIAGTNGSKATDVENTVTKTLGVLQENGIYACALYLLSRPARESARTKVVMREILQLLFQLSTAMNYGWPRLDSEQSGVILAYLTEQVTQDLERLILAKELLEQMLIYARYGAKAR